MHGLGHDLQGTEEAIEAFPQWAQHRAPESAVSLGFSGCPSPCLITLWLPWAACLNSTASQRNDLSVKYLLLSGLGCNHGAETQLDWAE